MTGNGGEAVRLRGERHGAGRDRTLPRLPRLPRWRHRRLGLGQLGPKAGILRPCLACPHLRALPLRRAAVPWQEVGCLRITATLAMHRLYRRLLATRRRRETAETRAPLVQSKVVQHRG